MRGRSGPDEGLPEVGAYLRVSGPSGPLTSVYSILPARRLTAMMILVTTFIIKSDSVPARRAGAGPLFSYEGGALWFRFCAGSGFFWWLYLSVVTKVAPLGARRLRWEVHICLSTGQAVNRFSF